MARGILKNRKLGVALLTVVVAASAWAIGYPRGKRISQPVAFNHYKHHVENGLPCNYCHRSYESQAFAGIPNIEVCGDCHAEDISENPEAKKVMGYVARGEPIPWVQMYRVRDHVRFSHRLHTFREVECGECHGATGTSKVPTRYRNFGRFRKTMRFCMNCHEERGASNDCNACHK